MPYTSVLMAFIGSPFKKAGARIHQDEKVSKNEKVSGKL